MSVRPKKQLGHLAYRISPEDGARVEAVTRVFEGISCFPPKHVASAGPEIVVVDHVRVDEKVVVESSVNLQNPVHRHLGHSGHSRLATHHVKAQGIQGSSQGCEATMLKAQQKATRRRRTQHKQFLSFS